MLPDELVHEIVMMTRDVYGVDRIALMLSIRQHGISAILEKINISHEQKKQIIAHASTISNLDDDCRGRYPQTYTSLKVGPRALLRNYFCEIGTIYHN